MAKKIQLRIKAQPRYSIIGISSHMPDYRLIYFLNMNLKVNLCRSVDFICSHKSDEKTHFPFFSWDDPNDRITISLLPNRVQGHYLIPELKNMDYLLVISDEALRYDTKSLMEKIWKIQNIILVKQLNPDDFKTVDSFVFSLELHMSSIDHEKKSQNKYIPPSKRKPSN